MPHKSKFINTIDQLSNRLGAPMRLGPLGSCLLYLKVNLAPLTSEAHMRGVSRVTQRIGILIWCLAASADTAVLLCFHYAFILLNLKHCSTAWLPAANYLLQRLVLGVRCVRFLRFVQIRFKYRC